MFHLICPLRNLLLCAVVSKCRKSSFGRQNRGRFKNKGYKVSNPGIQNRLKIFNSYTPNAHHTEKLDLDAMESDFMHAEEMYNKHESEEETHKETVQLKIVQRRYFKTDVSPNFLTWAEKEQICYLHNSDSFEWSAEKLSKSFPATENIITKIIKSHWKPDDTSQILKHDLSVQSNWRLLTEGKLKMDSHLKEHLLRFSKRDKVMYVPPNSVDPNSVEVTNPRTTEFLSIIESYKKSSKSCISSNTNTDPGNPLSGSQCVVDTTVVTHTKEASRDYTYTLDGSKSKTTDAHFTLSQHKNTFDSPAQDTFKQKETIALSKDTSFEIMNKLHKSNQFKKIKNEMGENKNSLHISDKENSKLYLEKITIPKNKWIRGGTYKVEECYYDDDGEFLYRVPGIK